MAEVLIYVEGGGEPVSEPSHHLHRAEELTSQGYGGVGAGVLLLGVLQCMTSVLGIEKATLMASAREVSEVNRP